jgi:hypothetical protein
MNRFFYSLAMVPFLLFSESIKFFDKFKWLKAFSSKALQDKCKHTPDNKKLEFMRVPGFPCTCKY